ncbi:ABC transporter ATP-binding protein [Phytoactinopolyspora endophytica]|uniref:ABC transporter ATP-binding protein n=1 Tax=Phytoactinopolyspora endophytica TaxID=1642495 RepID=UPI00101D3BD5|nr:ABC transporter ATP-binding protein [Phytoactinopolyspora endophytica]
MLEVLDVGLSYGATTALRDVSLKLAAGSRTALMGPSGSGKSSLLHCLAGVLVPDRGHVVFDGQDLTRLSDRERSRRRLAGMGVAFQFGDLVPELTVVENVMLPLQLLGAKRAAARGRALALLGELGIAEVADARTGAVSGGQAQRAAVARALVHEPRVVLADEPTGSLDTVNAEAVLDAMVALSTRIGATLLVVTHDNLVASHLDDLIELRDGSVDRSHRQVVG